MPCCAPALNTPESLPTRADCATTPTCTPAPGVRKTCVQAVERLAGEWVSAEGGEALPGFREFVMKQVRGRWGWRRNGGGVSSGVHGWLVHGAGW